MHGWTEMTGTANDSSRLIFVKSATRVSSSAEDSNFNSPATALAINVNGLPGFIHEILTHI